jgi:glutamine synthetase
VGASAKIQQELLFVISDLAESANKKLTKLQAETLKAQGISKAHHRAEAYRDKVFTTQVDLRKDIDALEQMIPASVWPVPTYAEMLFKL